jgi:hypothetical protein
MSRMLCVLLLAICLCSRADAELRCVPPAVDLGEVRGGPARQHRFELINEGKATIEILAVEPGCGCLAPRLDRKLLQAGERAALTLELRTAGQPNGPRSWNLRLRYRDGQTVREELLVVAATIRNEVTVEPSILALQVQDTLRQVVTVTDLRTPPLKVTALHVSSPALRATVQSTNGGITKLLLEAAAAKVDPGRHDAVLSIYTDDPLYSPLQLPITLTRGVKAAVTATPEQIEARVSAAAPVAVAVVRLRPSNDQKLQVESATADDPGITCTWAAGPGSAATLRVRVDARRLTDRTGPRKVQVRLAEPAGEVVTIPVAVRMGK